MGTQTSAAESSRTGPPSECDVVVVGAGIVGLAAARELALRHDAIRVVVLDREATIGAHQTSHSSGVVHAGIYYPTGSLKARLCVAGARELYAYCDQRHLGARRVGKLIVATRQSELERLHELERCGRENGVRGLRRVAPDELHEIEPHVAGLAGLHSPETGVVDFARVARSYAEDLELSGGLVFTNCAVDAVDADGDRDTTVRHAHGTTRARAVVVCAGVWSDRLARAAGAPEEPRIVPFRGGYLRLRPERAHLVRANVYPVPNPELPFLGVHLTRTHDDDVLLGPSALMVGARDAYRLSRLNGVDLKDTLAWPGTWRLMSKFWRSGVTEIGHAVSRRAFVSAAQRFIPELRASDFVAGPAGIRAQAVARDGTLVDDFIVSRTERTVYVRNAPSPAATSSLPLGRLIADELEPMLGG